jgi:hypothetical protein
MIFEPPKRNAHCVRRQRERTKNNMMRTMCATYFLAAHIVRLAFWRFNNRSLLR